MTTIHVDDETADGLARQAHKAGLSVPEYLRTLVPPSGSAPRPDWDEMERQFLALSSQGPSLPADFSRADTYADHE